MRHFYVSDELVDVMTSKMEDVTVVASSSTDRDDDDLDDDHPGATAQGVLAGGVRSWAGCRELAADQPLRRSAGRRRGGGL